MHHFPTAAEVAENLSTVKHKIAVISGKGGVGKTTFSVNFAASLANAARKTGLLDADIDGPNVPKMLGIQKENVAIVGQRMSPVVAMDNLEVISMAFLLPDPDTPVIWRGPLKASTISQFLSQVSWRDVDYLVVDLPPGTGDAPLTVAQQIEDLDGFVVITTPQDVALLDARKAVRFAQRLEKPVLGIVENMSGMKCPCCGEQIEIFRTGGGRRAAAELGLRFLGAIPFDPRIVEMGDEGRPFVLDHGESPAGQAFHKVVVQLTEQLDEQDGSSSM